MRMGQREYQAALERLGLTQVSAAEFLDIGIRTSHGYANGSRIPRSIAWLLRILVRSELKPDSAQLEKITAKLDL